MRILQQPSSSITSAGNSNFYTVSSSTPFFVSSSYYNDFCYIADLIVTNAANPTGSQQARLISYPDTATGYGVFDLKNIANSFVSYDFAGNLSDDTNFFNTASNSSCQIQLQFGERFVFSNQYTQSLNLVQSFQLGYYNGAITFLDSVAFDQNSLVMASGSSGSQYMSTYYKNTINAWKDLRHWKYFYNVAASGGVQNAIIDTYNGAGAHIGSYNVNNPYSAVTGVTYMSCGYPQINQLNTASYSVTLGSAPIITPNVSSYIISLFASGSITPILIDSDGTFLIDSDGTFLQAEDSFPSGDGQATTGLDFLIMDNCGKFRDTSVEIYFMNHFGGFESFLATKKNIKSATRVNSQYLKQNNKVNPLGQIGNKTYDQALTNFWTQTTNQIEINTDWLSDDEVTWLKGLFKSPVIFVAKNKITQAAIYVEDGFTEFKRVNNRLNTIKFTLEFSQPDYSQGL